MLPGLNHNVRYKDRLFHVQTEDGGLKRPQLMTHVFIDGSVIASEISKYQALLDEGNEDSQLELSIRKLMQDQHKDCIKALLRGQFDPKIAKILPDVSELPAPTSELPPPPLERSSIPSPAETRLPRAQSQAPEPAATEQSAPAQESDPPVPPPAAPPPPRPPSVRMLPPIAIPEAELTAGTPLPELDELPQLPNLSSSPGAGAEARLSDPAAPLPSPSQLERLTEDETQTQPDTPVQDRPLHLQPSALPRVESRVDSAVRDPAEEYGPADTILDLPAIRPDEMTQTDPDIIGRPAIRAGRMGLPDQTTVFDEGLKERIYQAARRNPQKGNEPAWQRANTIPAPPGPGQSKAAARPMTRPPRRTDLASQSPHYRPTQTPPPQIQKQRARQVVAPPSWPPPPSSKMAWTDDDDSADTTRPKPRRPSQPVPEFLLGPDEGGAPTTAARKVAPIRVEERGLDDVILGYLDQKNKGD